MTYQPQQPRPAPNAAWTAVGDGWHDVIAAAVTDVAGVRSQLTAVKAGAQQAAGALAPLHSPGFTGAVTGITKSMVGLGNVDNTADSARTVGAAQFTAGALPPARLPAEVAAIRVRVPGGEFNPTAKNWEPRPTGYPLVVAFGALPSPADAAATDLHAPTTVTGGAQPILLGDGSTIPVWPSSGVFDQAAIIGAVTVDARSASVYDAYTQRLPAEQFLTAFRQMAANACALLYTSQAQVPYLHPTLTLRFLDTAGLLAQTSRQGSWIEFGTSSVGAAVTASYTTHEVVHLIQHSPTNGTAQTSGVIEGIADWVLIQMGYHTAQNQRPGDGGTAWDAGYDTTGFFLDWVERTAGGGTPGFVRSLNATMNSTTWTPSVITGLNARNMTVDALWSEYKQWLSTPTTPAAVTPVGNPPAPNTTWTLQFRDEFDTGTLNTSVWVPLRGAPGGTYNSPVNPSGDDHAYAPNRVTVTNGMMRLAWDRTPITSYGVTYPYTAGYASTAAGLTVNAGCFIESRVQIGPANAGLWPALWLLPYPVNQWPPEVDIAEWVTSDTPDGLYHPHFNVHWQDSGGVNRQAYWQSYGPSGTNYLGSGWHTYGLLWRSNLMQVYLDGVAGPSYTGPGLGYLGDMYVVFSTGVMKGNTPANGSMDVDYLRVWR